MLLRRAQFFAAFSLFASGLLAYPACPEFSEIRKHVIQESKHGGEIINIGMFSWIITEADYQEKTAILVNPIPKRAFHRDKTNPAFYTLHCSYSFEQGSSSRTINIFLLKSSL